MAPNDARDYKYADGPECFPWGGMMDEGGIPHLEAGAPVAARHGINIMGRCYEKIAKLSAVTRYLTYITPVGVILALPLLFLALLDKLDAPMGTSAVRSEEKGLALPGPPSWVLFTWLELAWLALWASRALSWLLSPVLVFLVGGVHPIARRYAGIISSLTTPLSLFLWLLVSWLAFQGLAGGAFPSVPWVAALHTILGALTVSSAVLLGEKAIIRLLSVTYHERSLVHRIQKNNDDITQLGEFCDRGKKDNFGDLRQSMHRNKKVGEKIRRAIGKQDDSSEALVSVISTALKTKGGTEELVAQIWNAFQLSPDQSLEVPPEARRDWLLTVDADGDGRITRSDLYRSVRLMAEEKRRIRNSWSDISQAIRALDKILLCVVFLLAIFIFRTYPHSSSTAQIWGMF